MCDAHRLGGVAKRGIRAGGSDFGHCLAPTDKRASIDLGARDGLHRKRFAGQHRLVEQHRTGHHACISWYDAPQREPHNVPRHDVDGGSIDPNVVTTNARQGHQTLFQQRQRGIRMAFLDDAKSDIQQQQRRDHRRLDAFADSELHRDRGFQHPGNRRPEMPRDAADRMFHVLGRRVRAEPGHKVCRLGRFDTNRCLIRL